MFLIVNGVQGKMDFFLAILSNSSKVDDMVLHKENNDNMPEVFSII